MRAASRQPPRYARGAHATTDHRPLQPRVMCACHRTSPTATPLICDGLYSPTSAEQRGRNGPKLPTFIACHCRSGATPARSSARRRVHRRSATLRRPGAGVRVRGAFAPRQRRLYRAHRSCCRSSLARRSGARRPRMKGATARRQRRVNEESSARAKVSDSRPPTLFPIRPHNECKGLPRPEAVQRPRANASCAPRAHNGNAAPAARTRRRVTVRCNCLLCGWHTGHCSPT